jgi:hypothetical protein
MNVPRSIWPEPRAIIDQILESLISGAEHLRGIHWNLVLDIAAHTDAFTRLICRGFSRRLDVPAEIFQHRHFFRLFA